MVDFGGVEVKTETSLKDGALAALATGQTPVIQVWIRIQVCNWLQLTTMG